MMRFNTYIIALLAGLSVPSICSAERSADKIFTAYCFACHGTGWEDAPVIGDSFAWTERREKGLEILLRNTLEGVNAMPAKGACTDCSDEELLSVIKMLIAD